ncbi:hypothetical protein E2C01_055930 [Portunus trituberculatus]|uniref:Uncharacterized protein n=1 Tax=Portunus trituberculatus TaxID=210409 RepID=A0A5B7GW27_PORTR|nr:hypothetical protein [Portunus trituberculatus]
MTVTATLEIPLEHHSGPQRPPRLGSRANVDIEAPGTSEGRLRLNWGRGFEDIDVRKQPIKLAQHRIHSSITTLGGKFNNNS